MRLLFIDTETTSLNPLHGQIIEIAGLVVDFDPTSLKLTVLDSYSSLVRLRYQMDERITRITGLTADELGLAPDLIWVQKNWADWLEKYGDIKFVVGHSIDFDLGFLRSESWFLPENCFILDTLLWSKILLPTCTALNLEYLLDKLELKNRLLKLFPGLDLSQDRSHRALFDAQIDMALLSVLIDKLIDLPASAEFHQFFAYHFGNLGIIFHKSTQAFDPTPRQPPISEAKIDFTGKLLELPLNQKAKQLIGLDLHQTFQPIFELSVRMEAALVICQVYTLYLFQNQFPTYDLKVHGRLNRDFELAELLINYVSDKDGYQETPTKIILPLFENILFQVNQVAEECWPVGKMINLVEIMSWLDDAAIWTQVLAGYDFWLLVLEPYWDKGEFAYYPTHLPREQQVIKTKFQSFLQKLDELKQIEPNFSGFKQAVWLKIKDFLQQINQLSADQNYTFKLIKNQLLITRLKLDFRLDTYLTGVWQKWPELVVSTNLGGHDLDQLLELLGLDNFFRQYKVPIVYQNGMEVVTYKQLENVDLRQYCEEALVKSEQDNNPTLILCGQNSSLKETQKLLVQNFQPESYLILGETGSLTKIASKLIRGFHGLAVCKIGDFGFLSKLNTLPKFSSITILTEPYLYLHQYLKNLANQERDEDFLKKLKLLHLKSHVGRIYYQTSLVPVYIRSYKT
jgi:DNA polymerase III epsilon subunit-like protein